MSVTPALVERCKAFYVQTKNDRTYMMYDFDVEGWNTLKVKWGWRGSLLQPYFFEIKFGV